MPKSVSLILSSGGSKGLAQIGVIKELEQHGFKIHSVSGSSIGSVIGGLYAMDKLPEFTAWVKTLDRKTVWGLMDFTISTNGLLKGVRVLQKMKTFIPDVNIEEMRIPFSAIATDILNEKVEVLNSGSFYEAIRASVAIPTLMTPVISGDKILVDGAVLSPIPIEYVTRQPGDILVVVNLYGEKKNDLSESTSTGNEQKKVNPYNLLKNITKFIDSGDKRSMWYFSLLKATTMSMIHKIAQQTIEKFHPDILINIPYDAADTLDFYKAEELIKLGEDIADKAITGYLKRNAIRRIVI
jgi:NTE family protein